MEGVIFSLEFGLIVLVISLIPLWRSRRKIKWFLWDYLVPIYPPALAVLSVGANMNEKSMGNFFLEPMLAAIFGLMMPWLRLLFPGKASHRSRLTISIIFFFLPMIFVLIVSRFMPKL